MKKILLSMLLLGASCIYAVPIKLADAQTMKQQFSEKELDDFVEKTGIIEKLAGKELEHIDAFEITRQSVLLYCDNKANQPLSSQIKKNPNMIYEIVFKGYPQELKEVNRVYVEALMGIHFVTVGSNS